MQSKVEPSLEETRAEGLKVLFRELGLTGAARFLQGMEGGVGDYTTERHQWLGDSTVDEVLAELDRKREDTPGR